MVARMENLRRPKRISPVSRHQFADPGRWRGKNGWAGFPRLQIGRVIRGNTATGVKQPVLASAFDNGRRVMYTDPAAAGFQSLPVNDVADAQYQRRRNTANEAFTPGGNKF